MFVSRIPFGVRCLAHKEGQKLIFHVIWQVNRMSKLNKLNNSVHQSYTNGKVIARNYFKTPNFTVCFVKTLKASDVASTWSSCDPSGKYMNSDS